jgi:ATP-dependent DNA helicase RecG
VVAEWIDAGLKAREGWPDWGDALQAVHAPEGAAVLAMTHPARQRLAYDELFAHQLMLSLARASLRRAKGVATVGDGHSADQGAGKPAVSADRRSDPRGRGDRGGHGGPLRMNRLLQGDVGAGKTLVALLAC